MLFPFTWLDPAQDVFLLKIVSNVTKMDFYVKMLSQIILKETGNHTTDSLQIFLLCVRSVFFLSVWISLLTKLPTACVVNNNFSDFFNEISREAFSMMSIS